ncbi:MAG: type III-B CRISPR module RAMP protein Cmr4 [Candidatus Heimdallarchaeota archaeon]|nr:type III-B CRISPR module RAMP protein Cmr4 [Candidatus Heimdallarchaeota archaeon]
MFKKVKPFFMIVETPLHAGSGSEVGIVDLPIQRERHTDFPKVEASGIKGCIREVFYRRMKRMPKNNGEKEALELAFGPEKDGSEHAGALGFTDARLLLFPVKSMKGVFAWITCPKVLSRFITDLKLADIKTKETPEENTTPNGSKLYIKDSIILEEYTFSSVEEDETCTAFAEWLSTKIFPQEGNYQYWQDKVKTDLVVLPDDAFRDFVTLSTEVITRTRISSDTGTVEEGALFREEYLPAESVLYSLALTTPVFAPPGKDKGQFQETEEKRGEELVMEYFTSGLPPVIQVGGNKTTGKGLVRTNVWR